MVQNLKNLFKNCARAGKRFVVEAPHQVRKIANAGLSPIMMEQRALARIPASQKPGQNPKRGL